MPTHVSRHRPTKTINQSAVELSLLDQGGSLRSPRAARPPAGPALLSPPRSSPAAVRAAHTAISRLTLEIDASGGGAQAPGWTGRRPRVPVTCGVRGELPSRLPSTQAKPSRRGPWRPGRSYSGALHLDARDHARSTVCGSTADGMGAGVGGSGGTLTGSVLDVSLREAGLRHLGGQPRDCAA